MKRLTLLFVGAFSMLNVIAQTKKPATAAKPATTATKKPVASSAVFKTNKDSASYAIGIFVAQNLKQSLKAQGLENMNFALMQKALADELQNKKPVIDEAALNACVNRLQEQVASAKAVQNGQAAAKEKEAGRAFLAANGKRPEVVTLPSGLQYEILKAGTGTVKPTLANTVKCHYHGTLLDGFIFDSSVDRGEPISFPLSNVIIGWQEALQLMTVGSKWKLYIPSELAYGDNPSGQIKAGSTLVFEVELLGIE